MRQSLELTKQLNEAHKREIAQIRKEYTNELELATIDIVAHAYVDQILGRSQNMKMFETYDAVKTLTEQLNELKNEKEAREKEMTRQISHERKASKDKAIDAENLYQKLRAMEDECKKKDRIIDETEIEFNQMRDAQEAYRD